jgi:hypothetical protein
MKILLNIMLTLTFLTSCQSIDNYEKEESVAIEDFANDFLIHYPKLAHSNIDNDGSTNSTNGHKMKVYISDALLPISQIKEDNEWMFDDNYFGTADSAIFRDIVASKEFDELKYREFEKEEIELPPAFIQFPNSNIELESQEEYIIISFSRVCFDQPKENGIVVIDYRIGFDVGTMGGYNMALLIKKENGKWGYIPR